jgi:hypothetical protein
MFTYNVAYFNGTFLHILKETVEATQSVTGMSVKIRAGYSQNGDRITWLYVSFRPYISGIAQSLN